MSKRRHLRVVGNDDDYRGLHTAPDPGEGSAPFHDVENVMPDWYSHPEYYDHGDEREFERETVGAIKKARGKPDAQVTIYRALPRGHSEFNKGDWVTPSPNYARRHGYDSDDPEKDMPVIKATVRASDLWTNGDSHHEWGYHGPTVSGEVHYAGGKSAAAQHRCEECGKPTTEVWQVPVEDDGVLNAKLVGRDCMNKLRAQGWDNAQQLTPDELAQIKREAGTSWRPMTADKWWLWGDAVIGSDGRGASGHQTWEVYERGRLVGLRHSLLEAKAVIEDKYGVLAWQRFPLEKVKVDHPLGTTTEFTAPTTVIVVETLPE